MSQTIKTKGIVFRQLKYRESSIIIDVFTEQKGLKSYLIHGVRSQKPTVSPMLVQPGSSIDLVAYDAPQSTLNKVKEVKAGIVYTSLPFSVPKSAIGQFIIEVCRQVIKEETPQPELYAFMEYTLTHIDQSRDSLTHFPIFFLLRLCEQLGFGLEYAWFGDETYLDLKEGAFCPNPPRHKYVLYPELATLLRDYLQADWLSYTQIENKGGLRHQLFGQVVLYLKLHVENFGELHSPDILRSILK